MPGTVLSGTAADAGRAGMSDLVARWRRMVDDGGTAVWTADEAQELLDTFRTDVYGHELTPAPQYVSGTTVWKVHLAGFENLETAASGTAGFRLYDANGSAISSGFTADYLRGIFTFAADQRGSARYVDARSYDLNAAAAAGWREWMASKASLYRFSADGASYDRNQWFDHCQKMADYYDRLSKPSVTTLTRADVA
jgi:hypothetical protein